VLVKPLELRAQLGDERGAVAILFAILTPAFLFLLLLVVDVGNWYVHHKHLQMQADAAALAGGAHFGDCFSSDPSVAGAADDTIRNAATEYAGGASSAYNAQVGGGSSRVTTLYNSKTFAVGGPGADDTEEGGPCETPHLMLDVKQTEADVPYILASLVDALVPGADTVVPAINARARVELKRQTIVSGSLPLAVPDIDPRRVTATFVNEATGAAIGSAVSLTKGPSVNGLNYWSGSTSLAVPADRKIGVRIGLGAQSGTCDGAAGTGGSGFVCYDYNNSNIGLSVVQGVGSGGSVDVPKPRVWATTVCTGAPFFSDAFVTPPATTCAASIQAVLQTASGTVGPAQKKLFDASLNGAGLNVTKPFTYDSASGYWTTGYVFAVPVQGGPVDVSLTWQSTTGNKQSYSKIQRVYSGSDDTSGPVKALALSTSTPTLGAPYTLSAGTHTINIDVGVEGSLNLSTQAETVMLRLTGGSRSSAVACDGTGAAEFRNSIINGCRTPYQLNPVGYCPDPNPPVGPADCIPLKTGTTAGPTLQALDTRYSACPANNWPAFDAANDPRVVKLMITDFSSLGGSGTTEVPVTNFAAFYITGWTGSACANNDPPPGDVSKGAIWGHFMKYIEPDPDSTGTETCDPLTVTPCVPVLVK
jgi:Putative Flp pilus-assembly TadE/G-like